MHYFFTISSITILLCGSVLLAQDSDSATTPEPKEKVVVETKPVEPVIKNGSVEIDGKTVDYTATTGKVLLKDDKGKARASVFYTSYTVKSEPSVKRPVMFAFNGGPGSSSVWLHLGILGPKRLEMPGNGSEPIVPPARVIDNAQSLLDVCDLVFIDPVSTGYSRAEGETDEKEFHGLKSDIESVGDFIRLWITQNKRWDSPKYLCGESYGGIRAAGLSSHLQSRYGMSLNGVVLLSSLLDYRTLFPIDGSPLYYQVFLPTFATTALYHGKVTGKRDEVYAAAKEFAFNEYALALLKGNELPEAEKTILAGRLAAMTGISAEIWERNQLRLTATQFRGELLKAENKVIGRFDARVAWDSTLPGSGEAEYDPSYSLALGAFSTAMLSYLSEDLGWTEDQPYEILTSVFPWKYGADNRIVNMTDSIATAIRDNPKMRVLVMGAHADLATPPEGVSYSVRQLVGYPASLKNQIEFTYYDAGHMFYLNPPDLKKARKDLVDFVAGEE